jgi:MYXO-CTERM domain-containing protein
MFDIVEQPYVPYAVSEEPPPPGVPLDGGLVALIAAGGIAGYRRLRARQTHTV